jgi:hypothetical protein
MPKVTKAIAGLKQEESDFLLKFLQDHIARGIDYQVRVRWEKGTVVVWDVSISHSPLLRHIFYLLSTAHLTRRRNNLKKKRKADSRLWCRIVLPLILRFSTGRPGRGDIWLG